MQYKCVIVFVLRILLLYLFATSGYTNTANPDVFKFYNAGWTPELRAYYIKMLNAVLDATEPMYGPYKLERYNHVLSPNRAIVEIERGKNINLQVTTLSHCANSPGSLGYRSSLFRPAENSDIGYACIRFPALRGLLGLRQLLIRKQDKENLASIRSVGTFLQYSAGFAQQWEDASIFKKQKIPVVEVANPANLIDMLRYKRFDYIPLSVLEMHNWYRNQKSLSLADNTLIYYPIQMYLMISTKNIKQVERLREGIAIIEKNEKSQSIFADEFSSILQDLSDSRYQTLVVVKSPLLSDKENLDDFDEFIARKMINPSLILRP